MQSKILNKILKSHPLAVLMVLEAIQQYSAKVAVSKVDDYPPMGLVDPDCWVELGKNIQDQLNDRKAFK
jgi:hypothetical protein